VRSWINVKNPTSPATLRIVQARRRQNLRVGAGAQL
jgi:hypothetical protein